MVTETPTEKQVIKQIEERNEQQRNTVMAAMEDPSTAKLPDGQSFADLHVEQNETEEAERVADEEMTRTRMREQSYGEERKFSKAPEATDTKTESSKPASPVSAPATVSSPVSVVSATSSTEPSGK